MATYTPNLNLGKPEETDPFGNFRQLFNDNMDILDNGGGGGGDSVTWTQIQQSGTKIAEIEINGVTTDVYAPQGAPPFTALIIITADTGSTITATKGADTYTATEVTTGQYEVTVDSIGTWTISDGTLSDTVTVTAQTTYYVTLSAVPDGRTVTPTDDIQIWLNCADIWDKTYTTLAEVLADTTTLLALINSPNAVDYMVRSTTWAVPITVSITDNSTAMSYIGLNNYCANTLLADSTWNEAIQNSEYFELVDNVKVPAMTSNTTPSGECSANAVYGASYPAWKAFDGDDSTFWIPTISTSPNYIEYDFASLVKVKKVTMKVTQSTGGGGYPDVPSYVQAWNGEEWVSISNTVNVTTSSSNIEYTVNNDNVYSKHRIYFNGAVVYDNNRNFQVNTLQFYGREDV